MSNRMLPAALAFAFAALASCTPGSPYDRGAAPAPRAEGAVVRVENNNWSDIAVYALQNGQRTRLGSVVSMTRETLRLPHALVTGSGHVRLVADPIGSRQSFVSDPIVVAPGQTVEWRVENHLPLSSLSIRWR